MTATATMTVTAATPATAPAAPIGKSLPSCMRRRGSDASPMLTMRPRSDRDRDAKDDRERDRDDRDRRENGANGEDRKRMFSLVFRLKADKQT